MADPSQSDEQTPAETEEAKPRRPVNWFVVGGAIALVGAIAASVFFANRFVEDERARNLQAWQIRLGIVADSRAAALNEWIEQNFVTLRELTENASLQLYMTELQMAEGDPDAVTDEPAQASYLRNLLVASAERAGFKPPPTAGEIDANIERVGVAGLGLTDADGKPIVSTPSMPPIAGKIRSAVAKALEGEPAIIDIFMGASNLPTIGFALPVFGVQSDEGAEGIGVVVGLRIVDQSLYSRLVQPGSTEATAETYFVRRTNGTVEYLSPLADGTPPLKRTLAIDTPNLAAAIAIEKPGGFGIVKDYLGEEVLTTSRSIANLPWVLIRKITRDEALSEVENRLNTMLYVFVTIIVIVTVTVIAVWRHGSSVRATEAAQKFRVSSERFENITKFMNVVSNSQPTMIAAVDGTTTFTYANEPVAKVAGIPVPDVLGKTMASVIGPVKAKSLADINTAVLAEFENYERDQLEDSREQARRSHVHTFADESGEIEVMKSDHIPLRGDRDHPPGVLMVLDDITELSRERIRSDQMFRQLINTLVGVVDRRDPFSAHHSTRTAEVGMCIADEMDLPEIDKKTIDVAGSLMSLGKIFIPLDTLGRGGEDLAPDELEAVANSHLVSAELLKDVPFDGQVVETIRQIGETWDGQGPLGLSAEDILLTARVVAVANMFVRRVSARAYREGMTFDEITDALLADAGKQFDRRPVSALINYLQNRSGAEKWANFRERPAADAG